MSLAIGEDDIELVTINGLQFRKAKIKRNVGSRENQKNENPVQTKTIHFSDEELFENEKSDSTISFEGGSYTTKLKVAPIFFKFFIGKKGSTKTRIQKETGATILIPSQQSNSNEIVIRGPTRNSVENAKTRIEIIRDSAKKTLEPTHFLSIPLTSPEIQSKIESFFKELKEKYYDNETQRPAGFDPSIFINPKQLHLTIVMLKLFTSEDIERVVNFLKKNSKQIYDILETRSLLLRLQGLEIMNDDPSAVDVLYLKVHEVGGGNRLERLCQFLVESLEKEELIEKQEHKVKLHVTLLNTRHRSESDKTTIKSENNEKKEKTKDLPKRVPFDARKILQTYGNFDIGGPYKIESLHLSQRGTYDTNGYYHCIHEVKFP